MLSNGGICSTLTREVGTEDSPVTSPISLSDDGSPLITPVLKKKKTAERDAANAGAVAEMLPWGDTPASVWRPLFSFLYASNKFVLRKDAEDV